MTNEEAKKMLEAKLKCLIAETSGTNHDCNMRLCDGCSLNYEQGNMGEQKQALEMAIKALEQQSNRCDSCKHSEERDGSNCYECVKGMADNFEAQPTDAAEGTRDCKTCIHSDKGNCAYTEECHECMWESKHEQPPCEDCISRAYIEPIVEELENICINGDEYILSLLSNIKNAPPVTPQRPKGKWIDIRVIKSFHYDGEPRVRCSRCGNEEEWSSNYCPNCGAEMEVEE